MRYEASCLLDPSRGLTREVAKREIEASARRRGVSALEWAEEQWEGRTLLLAVGFDGK